MNSEPLLTPEEYYQRAYKRNIDIGEMLLKLQPKPNYSPYEEYSLDFDKRAIYKWTGNTKEGGDSFTRMGDGKIALFTKYSHIKLK